ncbi:hypothetical protein B4Q13_15420 [Lacticaseibacillus rhamnosus]
MSSLRCPLIYVLPSHRRWRASVASGSLPLLAVRGDQFFVPDSWQFYFNDLPGVKYLRYVPNTEHSLRGSDAWMTLEFIS